MWASPGFTDEQIHLFAAFELAQRHPELRLPELESQIGTWLPWADPLEERPIPYGLTPFRTFTRLRQNVLDHLERDELPIAPDYDAVRLRQDGAALSEVRRFLAARGVGESARDDATLRELWVLLFGHESLFVTFE